MVSVKGVGAHVRLGDCAAVGCRAALWLVHTQSAARLSGPLGRDQSGLHWNAFCIQCTDADRSRGLYVLARGLPGKKAGSMKLDVGERNEARHRWSRG